MITICLMNHPTLSKIICGLIIAAVFIIRPSPVQGQVDEPQRFEVIAQTGGTITDFVPMPDGSILASEGSSLVRVSNTFGPIEVIARADLDYGMILALLAGPPYVLALAEEGLLVLPREAEGIPTPISFLAGGGQAMALHSNLIAVVSQQSGLRLIRLDTNGALTELSRLVLSAPGGEAAHALDVTLSSDLQFVYVATGEHGVHIIDIRDPAAPQQVGSLPGVTPAEAVTMSGALLAVGSAGRVVLADPSLGAGVVGVYAPLRNARRVIMQDGYAYIADETDGVKILWLAAPDRPLLIYGEIDHPASDLALVGNYLFVAGKGELRILDISSRYRPLSLGRIALDGNAESMRVEVNDQGFPQRAFIAMGEAGVAIIDVRNFALPQLLRQIPLDGPARAVHYLNGVLYVALDAAGLALIDASAFGSEQLYGTMSLPGRALDLEQRGSSLYIAAGQEGILALDVFYAYKPKLIGSLPLEAISSSDDLREASSITISGKRAYVADGQGFTVVDVSFPTRMGKLARIDAPTRDVGVEGVYLYAAGGSQVGVYDARATAEPIALRQYRSLSKIAHLTAEGSYLFATSADSGPDVVVISIVSPDAPSETSSTGLVGSTVRLRQVGDSYWLAAGFAGLRRFQLSEGGALIPRGSYAPVAEALVLEAQGGRLLAGGHQRWSILDTAALQAVGELNAENLVDLTVLGDRAAALTQSRLELYDLSIDDGSQLIATRALIGGAAINIDQTYVYVAGSTGLSIYEQSILMPVAEVRTPFPAVDLTVRGSTAYLLLTNGSLAVIELGDPTGGITKVRSIATRHPAKLITSSDGTVYGLADELLMRLFTSDLSRLAVSSDGTMPIIAPDGFFANQLFGLVIPGEQVRFYNVAGLDDGITWKSAVTLGTDAIAAVATDHAVFTANGEAGLASIARTAGQSTVVLDSDPVFAVHLIEDTLFAAGDTLTVWNVAGESPRKLASAPLTSPARHIHTSDSSVLVSMEGGVTLLNWNGASLTILGTLPSPAADQAVMIEDRVYISLHRGGLFVTDWADPSRPASLFTYTSSSGQFVQDLLQFDDRHLLVSWENGIDALDVSTIADAPHLSHIADFGAVKGIALSLSAELPIAVLSQGEAGLLLIDLANPLEPTLLSSIETPGTAADVLIEGQNLFIADGQCGLRAYDIRDPREAQLAGVWRGGYVASIAETGGTIFAGSGNRLYGLHYDAAAPRSLPPIPQIPIPADGSSTQTLETVLHWGPPEDSCDPLLYDVYFGVEPDPPFVGRVTGEPVLDLGKLEPERTYSWRVEAIDADGARSRGRVWSFTTSPGNFPDTLPPAPPPFLEAVQRNPMVPMGLITLFLVLAGIGALYWRGQHPPIQAEIPEWYSTQEEEPVIEDE